MTTPGLVKGRRVTAEGGGDLIPNVGDWFWAPRKRGGDDEDPDRWLGCVTEVGTNYVELCGPSGWGGNREERVHFNNLLSLEPETDPKRYIAERVAEHQGEVHRLLREAQQLTARLALQVGPRPAEEETQALALRGSGFDVAVYKGALTEAKDKTLPEIFKAVKLHNEAAAAWMGASLIPLQAQAEGMKPLVKAIEQRIFNVELYAGLVEEVVEVQTGEPAARDTPVYLFQRRAYMDEECLARYEAGGMEFQDIGEFDAWLARPNNRDRLLPHPRCILAMKVRRRSKDRRDDMVDFSSYFRIIQAQELGKLTFLYIRNGEQLFCLRTGIEFGAQLFPDSGQLNTSRPTYFRLFGSSVRGFVSEGEYEAIVEKDMEAEAERKAAKPEDRWRMGRGDQSRDYHLLSPESVYFDDATRLLEEEIAQHNRLVLVLQGLLDRSLVLHPHPPWHLWTEEGFRAALRLVHDDSRALTPGDAPDFEAYRARLNKSLKAGSVTVGQQDFWLRVEGERECRRRDNDWRDKGNYRPERWKPYDDPGPGVLARVSDRKPRARKCRYDWTKDPRSWERQRWGDRIKRTITVPDEELLNVDAYTPGDFRQFFDDPRTRADYLKWAPLLLESEEYHAGNRKVGGDG